MKYLPESTKALLLPLACFDDCDPNTGDYLRFPVRNPATGECLAHVLNGSPEEAERMICSAAAAFLSWKEQTANERADLLKRWADLVEEHLEPLSVLLTLEQGKPLTEARAEIRGSVEAIVWAAEEAKRAYGQVIPEFKQGTRILTIPEPVGVCVAITPWNFPSSMVARKVAPALAAGCAVVLKPAEATPLSALALGGLALRAGIPQGVLSILPCSGDRAPAIGAVLCRHPAVQKISFTGSTEVGKVLMGYAAEGVKRISLELGGNAPFLVFNTADLELAVSGAVRSKFRNAGQTCICANRFLVQAGVYDQFVQLLAEKTKALKMGDGMSPESQIGPLIGEEAVQKASAHISDALASGGSLVAGGGRKGNTLFFTPTVLANLTPACRLFSEETFGPVAGIFRFETEEEGVALANDSHYGLAAYFYSTDLGQCLRVSSALEYGMVAVNEPVLSNAAIPFGGRKASGFGREGGPNGLAEFMDTKYVLLGHGA